MVKLKKMFKILIVFLFVSSLGYSQKIHDLARTGTASQIEKYLRKHPEHLNLKSEQGATPLLLATYRGNHKVAELLLELGADPNQCFTEGSPIYGVIFKADLEMLDLLIRKGVDVNQACQFEELGYPIHLAINLHRINQIKQLLNAGARLDVKDASGRSIDDLLRIHQNPELNALFTQHN